MGLALLSFQSQAYSLNNVPSVNLVNPSSGSSYPEHPTSFATSCSDSDGCHDIAYLYFAVATPGNPANIFVCYDSIDNKLYMRNDSNTAWLAPGAPGSPVLIENSYAIINCASTSVNGSGNTLSVTWSISFKSAVTGARNTYLYVIDAAGSNNGGWGKRGTWTVLPGPKVLTTGLDEGAVDEDYSETLNAVNGRSPYTWSLLDSKLPDGLSLNKTTGAITGKPSAPGTFNFRVKVADANSAFATKTLSITVKAPYPVISDESLLDQTEARSALYFYNESLSNGFVKDTDYKSFSSVAATGFGLASLCVLSSRYGTTPEWTVTPAQAKARAVKILDNCIAYQNRQTPSGNSYGKSGFLFHFITASGTRQGSCEVSTVDMSIFLAGAITAGEYFGGEVKTKADRIYSKMDYQYFLNTGNYQFSHGWFPESGIMRNTWDRPSDETMLISILATGAHPANTDIIRSMYSWPRFFRSYAGHNVVNSYFGSLFTYTQGHSFLDFKKLGSDKPSTCGSANPPVNWWNNSVSAANANRQFCIDNAHIYSSYGPDSWGISICEYPSGAYSDFLGAAPCESGGGVPFHNGTIAPYGAIGCMPLFRTSDTEKLEDNAAFRALRHFYRKHYKKLWGKYGPTDSFDHTGSYSRAYLGIDLGIQVLMIENYRSGLIWKYFIKNAKVKTAAGKIFPNAIY